MNWRAMCLLAGWLAYCLQGTAQAAPPAPGQDPVPSVMWAFYHKQLLDNAPFVFDDRVRLLAPPFAEDARQVPLEIDARAFAGEAVRIIAWANSTPCRASSISSLASGCCPGCRSASASSRPRRCAPRC